MPRLALLVLLAGLSPRLPAGEAPPAWDAAGALQEVDRAVAAALAADAALLRRGQQARLARAEAADAGALPPLELRLRRSQRDDGRDPAAQEAALRWALPRPGTAGAVRGQALAEAAEAEARSQVARQALALGLRRDWLAACVADEESALAGRAAEVQRRRATALRALAVAGVRSDAEAAAAEIEARSAAVRSAREICRRAAARHAVGQAVDGPALAWPRVVIPVLSAEELTALALARRGETAVAAALGRRAEAARRQALLDDLPWLGFVEAGVEAEGSHAEDWTVRCGIEIPLGAGRSRRAALAGMAAEAGAGAAAWRRRIAAEVAEAQRVWRQAETLLAATAPAAPAVPAIAATADHPDALALEQAAIDWERNVLEARATAVEAALDLHSVLGLDWLGPP